MKTLRFLMLSATASVAILFWACGGDDDSTGGGPVDSDPPVVSQITVIDASHVDVVFNETVDKPTAEEPDNYIIVESAPAPVAGRGGDKELPFEPAAPGDTVWVGAAVRKADGKTVALSTIFDMNSAPYDMYVSGVRDAKGNEMTSTQSVMFTGTSAADVTPPDIVSRTPAPGATGVGVGQSVVVEFSEPMIPGSVVSAFTWSWSSGMVGWTANWQSATVVAFTPTQQLQTNTVYTAALSNTATDLAGNPLAATNWTFRTMPMLDTTRPTLVSTTPANGATNVSVDVTFQLTFSEAIDPTSIQGSEGPSVLVVPDPGDGIVSWTNGGRTLNFEPYSPLIDDQQYTLTIPEGAVSDLAGNPLQGSTVVTFTTGAVLPTGRIVGEVAGDPSSLDATNPAGAIVIAASNPFFRDDSDPNIVGGGVVGAGGGYTVSNLPNGFYWPAAFMESNGDGVIDPDLGDAFGAYGADVSIGDFTIDSVQVAGGGTVQNVDFSLFDPLVIAGTVAYIGSAHTIDPSSAFYVGVFDTAGFDPTSSPDYGTGPGFLFYDPTFRVRQLDDGLTDGTYFVGAFLDLNFNQQYDPASEPAGIYDDGSGNPIPLTAAGGRDVLGLTIEMEDEGSALFAWAPADIGRRSSPADVEAARRLREWLTKALRERERSR